MSDADKTPIRKLDPIEQLGRDMHNLEVYCRRAVDNGLAMHAEIPKLRKEMARTRAFHQWFPTAAIAVAIVLKVLHVV